jgi:glycosyltransferase involved in cell wall biosynthesis
MTRDQRDTLKIFKSFYIKYPHLKWVSFRDLRGMSREKFAESLSESCVSIWVDDVAGFGTFPLESMKCNVPVIGKVPNMVPVWMTDKNGLWTNNVNNIVDILGNFIQAWLEDLEPQELYEEMESTVNQYTMEKQKESVKEYYDYVVNKCISEFEESLSQYTELEITNETKTEENNG